MVAFIDNIQQKGKIPTTAEITNQMLSNFNSKLSAPQWSIIAKDKVEFIFDAVESFEYNASFDKANYVLENKNIVSDHIVALPEIITLTGILTKYVFKDNKIFTAISTASDKLATINSVIPNASLYPQAIINKVLLPVIDLTAQIDNIVQVSNGLYNTIFANIDDQKDNQISLLKDTLGKQLLEISTPTVHFKNYILKEISWGKRPLETIDTSYLTLTFETIKFANISEVTLESNTFNNMSGNIDKGLLSGNQTRDFVQNKPAVNKSIAAKLYDGSKEQGSNAINVLMKNFFN